MLGNEWYTVFFHRWELVRKILINPAFWAVVTILTGCTGLLGWILLYFPIITIFSGSTPIAPNTSLLFIILGLCILVSGMEDTHRKAVPVQFILSLFSLFVAILTIFDILSGYPVHIDRILTSAVPEADHQTGHMSLVTAFLFSIISVGLLPASRFRRIAIYPGVLVAFTGAVMLLGYLYGAPFLYGGTIIPVAFLTTIGFTCLGTGLIFLAMQSRGLSALAEQSVRARILHYFIPFIVGVLLLEGWIITYLLHKTDRTLVLTVVIVTFASIGVTILLSNVFFPYDRRRS